MLTSFDVLGPDQLIARRLQHYEHRQPQLEMADAVARAIEAGEHLIVEAATGVGKSFGYLVPAILHSTAHQQSGEADPHLRVVISTNTISLQEQLVQKDIPLLRSAIPREFSTVLAKGRRNYISLRRMESALARTATLLERDDEVQQLRMIRDWTQSTRDGSIADLDFRPLDAVWDEVASDSGNCMGRNCPRYKDCFYFRARRRLQNAQLLVVNHALFFSDLALRRIGASILPDYHTVVLDEAHTIESVAADHLGLSVTSGQVEYILNRLYNDRTNKGLLVQGRLADGQRMVMECAMRADEFFGDLLAWAQTQAEDHRIGALRVRRAGVVQNRLTPELDRLARWLRRYAQSLDDDVQRQDFVAAHQRLAGLASGLEQWRLQEMEGAVFWVESSARRRRQPAIKLVAAPIDVGPALREELFDKTPSVILTSATLTVGERFQFIKSRIGLTQCQTLRLGSSFDFAEQARLVVVSDMADPANDPQTHLRQCVEAIRHYVRQSDGHAFVLFTSYDMLRQVRDRLTSWLTAHDLAIYSQADGIPRSKLLDQFRRQPRGVLFGTDSFWQGVDVRGQALQNVIIAKLPFSVPDHPLLEARLERIQQAGGNPFMEYQVPEAVIKFKQGFGRLIRSRSDTGMVVVLDPRIRTRAYGRLFLRSLPDVPVQYETIGQDYGDSV